MKRIAIIGGGVSGLSAAYYLELQRRKQPAEIEYQLFEAGPRPGGILHSEAAEGFLFEAGAESFLTQKLKPLDIFRQLGIDDQLIASNDAQRETYVLVNGKLLPLPKPMHFFVPLEPESAPPDLFSTGTQLKFDEEKKLKPRPDANDESAASFVRRHFGAEFLERIADPMLAGIYGAESERLSAQTVLPGLVEMERINGSILRALQSSAPRQDARASTFTSLKRGMQQLADSIASQLPQESIHLNCAVQSIASRGRTWLVRCESGESEFDAAILAVPAHAAAKIVCTSHSALAELLGKIRYTSSMTVSLAFATGAFHKGTNLIPKGFGFLVPRAETRRLLACTFSHQKFSGRAPQGGILLRAFFGGARDPEVLSLSDSEAVALARRELGETLGITAGPAFSRVSRWPAAMPQYDVGHLALVRTIEEQRAAIPGLALIGNAYGAVGVPDCILAGKKAAERLTL